VSVGSKYTRESQYIQIEMTYLSIYNLLATIGFGHLPGLNVAFWLTFLIEFSGPQLASGRSIDGRDRYG
jgi:hypothetical protein